MKKQLCFLVLWAVAFSLPAQEAKPVVIVNTSGKVSLIPTNATAAMEVQSGAVAKSTGALQLGKGAKAVVYCNGQFQNIKGGQTIALSSICGEVENRRSLNFDTEFGDYVMAAIEMVAVAKQSSDGWGTAVPLKKTGDGWGTAVPLKKTGDGWGTAVPLKKTGDGWGGKGKSITAIMPFGKVKAKVVSFNWSKPFGIHSYRLVIMDKDNKIIHSVDVRDTFARIDLRTLNLGVGNKYHWKVSTVEGDLVTSTEMEFVIGTEPERKVALSNAKSSSLVKSNKTSVLRGLTEAIALENDQWFYDAHQIYTKLQKHHDNMVNYMHSAFWMRYGFTILAKKAVSG